MVLLAVEAPSVAGAIDLSNGVVFKLVPRYFPRETGRVTGLVGTARGFFPPLVLGWVKQWTDSRALVFVFLCIYAPVCLASNFAVFLRRHTPTLAPGAPGIPPAG